MLVDPGKLIDLGWIWELAYGKAIVVFLGNLIDIEIT